ncbi:MAG: acetoacetate decarboxylase family protein [Promethearchaeota archaeon]
MSKQLTMPIHTPWFRGPLRYTDSEMLQVVFTPTSDCIRKLLPQPLQPGLLGGAYIARFRNSVLAPEIWEAALVLQCTYKEHYGVFCVSMYIDNDTSVAAHREIWGFPAKPAKFEWKQKKDHITAHVIRNKVPLLTLDVDLEGPGEWIDTGAAINLKLIPSIDGKTYDLKQITAAKLETTIHEGKGGTGKLTFGNTDDEPLGKLFKLENIVAGLYFKLDLMCPFGEIIGEADL